MFKLLSQPITVRHTIAKGIRKALNLKAVCTSVDCIEHMALRVHTLAWT